MDLPPDTAANESTPPIALPDPYPKMDSAIRESFEAPEEVEIHRISPWPEKTDRPGLFFRHRSLGSMRVPTQERRLIVGRAMLNDLGKGMGFMCFDPGFGVRLRRGIEEIGLVICYRCQNARVHIRGTGSGMFSFSTTSLELLRKELRRGGVGWLWFWRRWFA